MLSTLRKLSKLILVTNKDPITRNSVDRELVTPTINAIPQKLVECQNANKHNATPHDMGYMACVIATHKVLQLWPLNGTLSVSDSLSIVCVRRKGGARTSCGEQVRPPHGKGNGTLHSFPIRRQIRVTGLFKMRIPTYLTTLTQSIGFVCIPPASQPSLDTPPPGALHVRRIDTRNKEGWRVGIGEITAGGRHLQACICVASPMYLLLLV